MIVHPHTAAASITARIAASLLASQLVGLGGNALAQTGPWSEGEIVIRSQDVSSGLPAIFRVNPETGATALLSSPSGFGGWAGSMVFDSFREGMLCNMSLAPDNPFQYRLWLVSHDGSAAAMPGFTGNLRALCSTGDGRVFFIRHTAANQGPTTIEYFDAQNVLRTLMGLDGVTPFAADVEHLLYDAGTNALVGSSSAQWAATHCGAVGSSLYRIPLSPDGLRVGGPVTCTAIPTTLLFGDVMALDHLPDGKVLVVTATAFLGAPHAMLAVDPATLAVTTFAEPSQGDINGGFWSARLGKAVFHANSGSAWWEPDGLRTMGAGQSGFGAFLATSLALQTGGGFSPYENVTEVDVDGPACGGFSLPYGSGLSGANGFVPHLGAIGCPDLGSAFTLSIEAVVGDADGALFAGVASAAAPLLGGTFLVGGPVLLMIPVAVGGAAGVANAGSLAIPVLLTDPILAGVDIYLQCAFFDAAAVLGVSLTNGLRLKPN